MHFHWLDLINLLADVITIASIWTLFVANKRLYEDMKKAREPRSVSDGCLEFSHSTRKVAINLVPLTEVAAIPRAGDRVFLPGETREGEHLGGGLYEVQDVAFSYLEAHNEVDQPCPALPSKIMVRVRSLNNN